MEIQKGFKKIILRDIISYNCKALKRCPYNNDFLKSELYQPEIIRGHFYLVTSGWHRTNSFSIEHWKLIQILFLGDMGFDQLNEDLSSLLKKQYLLNQCIDIKSKSDNKIY